MELEWHASWFSELDEQYLPGVGARASVQLAVISLMAFFGLIDIEGRSLLPGQFPWRDNKRSFSSERNFNGTFW